MLADPLRVRPRSSKELAGWIGVPADRLYHHLHALERARLVERLYGAASVEPPGDDATPEEMAHFLGQALEATRADINQAYATRSQGADRQVMLHRSGVHLTIVRLAELRRRFDELIREAVEHPDPDGVWTTVLYAMADVHDRRGAGEGCPRPWARYVSPRRWGGSGQCGRSSRSRSACCCTSIVVIGRRWRAPN